MNLIDFLRRALRIADANPAVRKQAAAGDRPWQPGDAPCVHVNLCGSLVAPMDAELQKKFRDACKPLPKRTYPGKIRTPKLFLFQRYIPLSGDEYLVREGKPTLRLEPKNEFKARKRAEWKQKVRGREVACVEKYSAMYGSGTRLAAA